MDEKAWEITEFAELLYNFRETMDIKSIKASIESFLLANHYRKPPEDKPPLLSDEEINVAILEAFSETGTQARRGIRRDRAVAQAQWNIWNEWYECIG